MKKHLKVFLSLLVFGLFTASTALAQNYPDATISSDEGIVLTETNPVVEKYEIDFSTFNWTLQNAQQAATYLGDKSNLITIEVDYPNSRLILKLDLQASMVQFWAPKHWKNHLATVR